MDASIVFQIPVDARSDIHPVVASYNNLPSLLVKFEVICLTRHFLNLKLGRSAFIDSFKQIINRISYHLHRKQNSNQG